MSDLGEDRETINPSSRKKKSVNKETRFIQNTCTSSKPEKGSNKQMIYPWGKQRIFSPRSKVKYPSDGYEETYAEFQSQPKIGQIWSLILADTTDCVGRAVVYRGDWLYALSPSMTNLEVVKKCLPESKMIPIYTEIVMMNHEHMEVQNDKWDKYFPSNYDIEVFSFFSHANMLIVDPKREIVERFEPHGVDYGEIPQIITDDMIQQHLKQFIPENYVYCHPAITCPKEGPQAVSGDTRCYVWSLLFLHLKLKNPHLSSAEISEKLIKESRTKYPISADWIHVMKNTLEELEEERITYTKETLERLNKLSNAIRTVKILDIAKDLLMLNDSSKYVIHVAYDFAETRCALLDGQSYVVIAINQKDEEADVSIPHTDRFGRTKWISGYVYDEECFNENRA